MPIRKINFPVLMLCLLVVLTLGYGLFTTTYRYASRGEPVARMEALSTYQVSEPPPAAMAPPPPASPSRMSLPGLQYEPAGPDVSPTAAPGVAFNYRYAYRLPAERIAEVQERHARACEQLGVGRCRITGMRYRVVDDRNIEAMLAVKLEPGIARGFGRSGTEAVVRADGKLIESDIAGTDAAAAIGSASRSLVQLRADLQRIEQRLAGRGLSPEERTSLDYQGQQLRQSIRGAEADRDEQQESLASTPMVFQYVAGEMIAAEGPMSLGMATERAFGNFASGMTLLMIILVTILPWALLAFVAWLIARQIARRLNVSAAPEGPAPLAA
jgi:hypothetical protein